MKYYKIINPNGHNGLIYHEGYNEDPSYSYTSDDGYKYGIHFAREDILAFLDYGTDLYEVEPIGHVYEDPITPKTYEAHAVNLKYIGKVKENIEFLVNQGANIHVDNEAALIFAVCENDLKLTKFLIDHGANVNARDGSALSIAVINENLELVELLLECGADVNCGHGYPLNLAITQHNLELIKLLLNRGADANCWDGLPLRIAADQDNLELAKLLIEYGADINGCKISKRFARKVNQVVSQAS